MRSLGVGAAAAGVTATCVLVGTTVFGAPAPVTSSRIPVTIKATSLDVGRLVYQDTVPVQTTAGTVSALELQVSDATFHDLVLDLPCVPTPVGGLTGRTTTEGLTTTPALTVYATDVLATIGGNPVRLSSTNPAYPPPPAGTVLVENGTVAAPTMVAMLATSGSLQAPTLRITASFCSPAGAAGLTGGAPYAVAPAPASPSATSPEPSSGPAPAPAGHPTGSPKPGPAESPASSAPPEPAGSALPQPTPAESSPPAAPDPAKSSSPAVP